MHFVVMGCGRVGSTLARKITALGHSVAVIDQDPTAFRRLGEDFTGRCVAGVGFDRRTLEEAGIREAAAFAAVSSGDNSNVISARVAREEYGVRTAVARIYDPRRAEVYERLGIATVATVRWTAAQMMSRLIPSSPDHEYRDVSGALTMVAAVPEASWVGTPLTEIEERSGARLVYLTRLGEGVLPRAGTRVQEGDRLHLMVRTKRLPALESLLAHPREPRSDQSTQREDVEDLAPDAEAGA